MTPELIPSKTLQRAAQAERVRLARALERNQNRQAALKAELADLEADERKLHDRDQLLRDVTSSQDGQGKSHLDAPPLDGGLKGAELREAAASLYYREHGAGHPSHYRHWFDLLTGNGIQISGKDPVATLLTNLNRSPVVVRGPEAGTYEIDEEAPERLRSRLAELHAEFADLAQVIGEKETASADLLKHRTELLSEIRRIERLVDEADRVLATPIAEAA